MTGKQLRNSILQWAIQGKLVPQDPNDEPASVLLKRIREEKARLVKEKKIKKDKNESIIYRGEDNSYYEKFADGTVRCIDDEIPFHIPQGWEWSRLGNVVTIGGGKRIPAGRKLTKEDTGQIYIRVSDMKNGTVVDTDIHYVPLDIVPQISKYTISSDDIYITVAGTIGRVGSVPRKFNGANLTENADKLVFYFLNKDCLITILNSPFVQQQITDAITKVGQPKLAIARIQTLLIPIIPLEEQLRICQRIKKILRKIEEYENRYSSFCLLNNSIREQLKKSILQEAIQGNLVPQIESEGTADELLIEIQAEKKRLVKEGKLKASALKEESHIFKGEDNKYHQNINGEDIIIDEILPFAIPSTWSWVRLGDLFEHNTGKALNGKGKGELLRKYLTTSNLYWDYFDFTKVKEMYFTLAEIDKCTITKGDLLICEGGDVGRAAIWNYDFDMCIQNHIHRLRNYLNLHTRFFYYVLRFYKYIGLIGGKGIGIQGLSSNTLHNIVVPLPPLQEQERITSRLDYIITSIMSR